MTATRIAGALALGAVIIVPLPLPAHARHAPRPVACAIVTAGGMFVIEEPCLQRLDKLRQINRRALARRAGAQGKSP